MMNKKHNLIYAILLVLSISTLIQGCGGNDDVKDGKNSPECSGIIDIRFAKYFYRFSVFYE